MRGNREFLTMTKILLSEVIESTPIIGINQLQRIDVIEDEIKFSSNYSVISYCQISSEPHTNFVLVAIEGSIFKYDIITKELLF